MNLNSEKFDARNLPLVDLKLQNWSKLTRVQNCLFDQKKTIHNDYKVSIYNS